jgi:hypothetical protein
MGLLTSIARARQAALDGLALLVLALVGAIALLTFRDYGLGWDDYTHAEMGELLLALYGSGFRDQRALSFVNLYMYGGGFDMLAAFLAKFLPLDLYEERRLLGAAIGLVGLFTTWRLGRRIGGPLAGLLAIALLATCPLYYGHMLINSKDAPFAAAMAILLLGLVRAWEEYPRPAPVSVMLLGVGLGLAVGTRVIGLIAAFPAGAALALVLTAETRALGARPALLRAGRFLLALLPGLLVGYAIMGLVWPWSVLAPLNPIRAVEYFSHFFEKPWKEMFAGALIPVPEMPWSYLPTLFALKLPEIFIVLALGGAVLALVTIADRSVPLPRCAAHFLVLGAAAVPILLTMITRPALYNGLRHFVFVLPPLAVLGGLAGATLFARLARAGRAAALAGAAVVAAGIASPAIEMARLHPYQYTHFNRIAGGIRAAEERYMLDYWGLAFKQAAQELRAWLTEHLESPPHGGRWKIAVCGPHHPAAVELGPEFETTWDSRGADFALVLGEFYCVDLQAPVLVEIAREGVVYARAYDIRGRSISTLLTIPPP